MTHYSGWNRALKVLLTHTTNPYLAPQLPLVGLLQVHQMRTDGTVSPTVSGVMFRRLNADGTASAPVAVPEVEFTYPAPDMPLTVDDLAAMEGDTRWEGHGYIRARRVAIASPDPTSDTYDPEAVIDPADVQAADQRIIDTANQRGWTYDRLFEWANSKQGRWFADAAYSGDLERAVTEWRLI